MPLNQDLDFRNRLTFTCGTHKREKIEHLMLKVSFTEIKQHFNEKLIRFTTTLKKLQQRGDDTIPDHPPQKHLLSRTNEFDDAPCLIIFTCKRLFHNYSED